MAVLKANLTHEQKIMLRSLAMSGSILSIIAGSLMTYWFWKLKQRTFRHQLVMLLVVSDTLKAVTEFIYPAVTIGSGTTANDTFCTIFGFFTSVFVDASDFAILVIAVNTALCIFFPSVGGNNTRRDEGIVYRFRHSVYVCWALYSVLLSSLAFLNKNQAYVSLVSWCYLPTRPFYWRIALSWGPRYFIIFFILVLYIVLFFHVKKKFKSFHRIFVMSSSDDDSTEDVEEIQSPLQVEPIAELDTHNLLGSPSSQSTPGTDATGALSPHMSAMAAQGELTTPDFLSRLTRPSLSKQHSSLSIGLSSLNNSRRPSVMSLVHSTKSTVRSGYFGGSTSAVKGASSPAEEMPVDEVSAERQRIVAQLKHLFIYPLVYLLMWILPFALHMTQYRDEYVTQPVIALSALSAFIIPLHGLVDVAVYAKNEKPWRSWRYRSDATERDGRRLSAARGSDRNTKEGTARPLSNSLVVDPNNLVAQRHLDEVREAEMKHAQRTRLRPISTPHEWWDLEEETGSEKSQAHSLTALEVDDKH